ncbi:leucine-rich repeat-containing protein 15-like [Diorhabda carinulata]|uniref:leucine-rich repeat-containing protein 15-like n=1 Tax=Diorhabda carinulata TaxID=1163345 RepID=UPI0025A109A6|nr:leucine-rich repeat-containing protein 15-like [Diorhabda carinulata]
MTSYTVFLVFTICLGTLFSYSLACSEIIQNVSIEVEDKDGEWSNITLNGCIQRSNLNGITVKEIRIRHQNISKLGKDYVKHLIKLDTLVFEDCQIESIAQGALRNLPVIRHVEITHNPIKKITGGIFDVFDTIKVLRLNNNQINYITDEALSNMTVTEVNFSHNNFSIWKSVWFAHSPYIEKLDFSFNVITAVPKRAFDGMPVLKELNFEHNKISAIGSGAFRKLSSLQVLNLRSNVLTTINVDVFGDRISINSMNLASNRFNDIPIDIFGKLKLKEISLSRNPWICPCLNKLYNLLFNKRVKVVPADSCKLDHLPICIVNDVCGFPQSNRGIVQFYSIIDKLQDVDRECIGYQ